MGEEHVEGLTLGGGDGDCCDEGCCDESRCDEDCCNGVTQVASGGRG